MALLVLAAMMALGVAVMMKLQGWSDEIALYFLLPGLGIGGLAFSLCGVAAHVTAEKMAASLNAISPEQPLNETEFPEIAPLARQLSAMQAEYSRKQEEFELTTKYMTEGLVLLNPEGKVLSVNDATRRIFHFDM